MDLTDINLKLSNLKLKLNNITNTIHLLSKDNPHYIMSDACAQNVNLYFNTMKEIDKLLKIINCNHDYICYSKDDEIWYQCKKCNVIL